MEYRSSFAFPPVTWYLVVDFYKQPKINGFILTTCVWVFLDTSQASDWLAKQRVATHSLPKKICTEPNWDETRW